MDAMSLRQFVPVDDGMSNPETEEEAIPVGTTEFRVSRRSGPVVALTLVATASTIGLLLLLMLMLLLPMATTQSDVTTATADGGGFRYPGTEERLRGVADDLDGDDVFAETSYGRLRGKRRKGVPEAGGESSFAVDWFLGVPYAKPPIGNLRFKATESPDRWKTTRDALRLSAVCPQKRWRPLLVMDKLRKDEDCLYLNIYSPVPVTSEGRNSSQTPLRRVGEPLYPVMVYIHGGSYHVGSGNTFVGAHVLAQQGVVVVTINYRLGILGNLDRLIDVDNC